MSGEPIAEDRWGDEAWDIPEIVLPVVYEYFAAIAAAFPVEQRTHRVTLAAIPEPVPDDHDAWDLQDDGLPC
jgi:hypothetical protein